MPSFRLRKIATRTRNATTNQFVYGEPGIRQATGRAAPIATALRYPRWAMTISAHVHSDPTSDMLVTYTKTCSGTM